jgi:hypothetical protein
VNAAEAFMYAGFTGCSGGSSMSEQPLEIFEMLDPELLKLVENTRELALSDGAYPRRRLRASSQWR